MNTEKSEHSPRFSVVVPVYQVERYLDACIESVTQQDFSDYEILLVDDGSKDRCPEICDTWAQKNERIHVIHQKNGGLSAARNAGIRKATGEYLVFLDGDDMLVQDALIKLDEQVKLLHEPDILMAKMQTFEDGSTELHPEIWAYPTVQREMEPADRYATAIEATHEMLWSACRSFYRTDWIRKGKLYFQEGTTTEDLEWFPRAVLAAQSLQMSNTVLYSYRTNRAGSIVTNISARNLQDAFSVIAGWDQRQDCPPRFHAALMGKVLDLYFILLGKMEQPAKSNSGLWQQAEKCKPVMRWASTSKQKSARLLVKVLGIRGFARLQSFRRKLLHK
jgi:glycosyltransferase involved in cell wall biosynthesis